MAKDSIQIIKDKKNVSGNLQFKRRSQCVILKSSYRLSRKKTNDLIFKNEQRI